MTQGPPFLVLGNPENRRVVLFVEALRQLGQPEPEILAHVDLLRAPERLADLTSEPRLVRIDSAGENVEVEQLLLERGFDDAAALGVSAVSPEALRERPPAQAQIVCPRQRHLGFLRYLDRLEAVFAERPQWRVLTPPTSIAELFDKRLTSRRYAEAGIPVPEVLDEVTSPEALRANMRGREWEQVFVKLTCGSSASCLAIFRHAPVGRDTLMTTIERTDNGWFNSLRVQRIDDREGIDEVLRFLLREGSIIERVVPKAKLDGAFMDLRVLVVDHEPAFTLVRQNSHPITNLHLGGRRGDPQAFHEAVPPEALAAAMESCRRVWACHDAFQVAVDVLFEPGFRHHRVVEANAFGDLLPGLTRDGLSVYAWQIREAVRAR